MKRLCVLAVLAALTFALCAVSICAAQDTEPSQTSGNLYETRQSAPANPDNIIKGFFPVQLQKTLDSSKLKEGDTVVCKTVTAVRARSGLMIPSGAKVIGHVTQAQARSKGDAESKLAIEFDKIEYAEGEEVPMKGSLQAVAPALDRGARLDTSAGPPQLAVSTAGRGNSNGSSPPPISSIQIGGPSSGTPILRPDSQGVLGVKNLQMSSNGELTSEGKQVKLDSGMQVLIHAEIELASR